MNPRITLIVSTASFARARFATYHYLRSSLLLCLATCLVVGIALMMGPRQWHISCIRLQSSLEFHLRMWRSTPAFPLVISIPCSCGPFWFFPMPLTLTCWMPHVIELPPSTNNHRGSLFHLEWDFYPSWQRTSFQPSPHRNIQTREGAGLRRVAPDSPLGSRTLYFPPSVSTHEGPRGGNMGFASPQTSGLHGKPLLHPLALWGWSSTLRTSACCKDRKQQTPVETREPEFSCMQLSASHPVLVSSDLSSASLWCYQYRCLEFLGEDGILLWSAGNTRQSSCTCLLTIHGSQSARRVGSERKLLCQPEAWPFECRGIRWRKGENNLRYQRSWSHPVHLAWQISALSCGTAL